MSQYKEELAILYGLKIWNEMKKGLFNMARQNNKECTLCHKKYTYCPTCDTYIREPFWKNMFCSEQCLNTYEIFNKYVSGVLNQEQAKNELSNMDLDFEKVLQGSFAMTYAEIMNSNKADAQDKKEDPEVIEKKIAYATKDDIIANATVEAKAIYPKSVKNKKRY